MVRGWREFWADYQNRAREAEERARQAELEAEARRRLREAKQRYGFPMDAGRES